MAGPEAGPRNALGEEPFRMMDISGKSGHVHHAPNPVCSILFRGNAQDAPRPDLVFQPPDHPLFLVVLEGLLTSFADGHSALAGHQPEERCSPCRQRQEIGIARLFPRFH